MARFPSHLVALPFVLALSLATGCASPAAPPTPTPPPASSPTPAPPSPSARPGGQPSAAPGPSPSAGATASGSTPSLVLEPTSGQAGTTIQIQGVLPGGPTAAEAQGKIGLDRATICWDGCLRGLRQDTAVRWSATEPGHFQAQVAVPAVPWLTSGGPHAVTPGTYEVGIQCLAPSAPGCLTRPAQATAAFHLTGGGSQRCQSGPCAELTLDPASAAPGQVVRVGGWAPLTEVLDGNPTGYDLALSSPGRPRATLGRVAQAMDGTLSGSIRLPSALPPLGTLDPGSYSVDVEAVMPTAPGGPPPTPGPAATVTPLASGSVRVAVASTTLTVTSGTSWAGLGSIKPLGVVAGGFNSNTLAVDPGDARRLAYCQPGAIRLSADGGATWASLSTTGAAEALAGTGFQLANPTGPGPAACAGVWLDPAHPDTLYATFVAARGPAGAIPPIYYVGLASTDRGRTWRPVPPPPGQTAGSFGGFQVNGGTVRALFQAPANGSATSSPGVLQTTDGGRTWAVGSLGCPLDGPCLVWGPLPNGIGSCAMHGYPQPLLISTDRGASWMATGWPGGANACGATQIAPLAGDTALLVSAAPGEQSREPLLVTRDGGRSWGAVRLPALPGAPDQGAFGSLQMLPSGALLALGGSGGGWSLLAPGAASWCAVPTSVLPGQPAVFHATGDRLWWLAGSGATVAAQSAPLGAVACAG